MALNKNESYEDLDVLKTFNTMQEVSDYMLELMKSICIDKLIVSEKDWALYPGVHYRNQYLEAHPFYQVVQEKLEKRQIDFTKSMQRKIDERTDKVFRNGLHKKQKEGAIKVEIFPPTTSQLEKIESGELEWVIRFNITRHLTPRYIKDGDKGEYPLVFELYISELKPNSRILNNNAVINAGNRQLKIGIVSPLKTSLDTEERDASIKRSRDAYRIQLMRVVGGGFSRN